MYPQVPTPRNALLLQLIPVVTHAVGTLVINGTRERPTRSVRIGDSYKGTDFRVLFGHYGLPSQWHANPAVFLSC
jgi:hypothetical protein